MCTYYIKHFHINTFIFVVRIFCPLLPYPSVMLCLTQTPYMLGMKCQYVCIQMHALLPEQFSEYSMRLWVKCSSREAVSGARLPSVSSAVSEIMQASVHMMFSGEWVTFVRMFVDVNAIFFPYDVSGYTIDPHYTRLQLNWTRQTKSVCLPINWKKIYVENPRWWLFCLTKLTDAATVSLV